MKHLTLVVHTDIQQDLVDCLRNMAGVSGFTFSHVEGHGVKAESDPYLAARDETIGVKPQLRVDILLEEASLDSVLDALRDTLSNIADEGVYWVAAAEQFGRL